MFRRHEKWASRQTIRQALLILEQEGLTRRRFGKGLQNSAFHIRSVMRDIDGNGIAFFGKARFQIAEQRRKNRLIRTKNYDIFIRETKTPEEIKARTDRSTGTFHGNKIQTACRYAEKRTGKMYSVSVESRIATWFLVSSGRRPVT